MFVLFLEFLATARATCAIRIRAFDDAVMISIWLAYYLIAEPKVVLMHLFTQCAILKWKH